MLRARRREDAIVLFIRAHIAQKHTPPSRRELAEGTGYKSISALQDRLHRLEREGRIRWNRKIARGVTLP